MTNQISVGLLFLWSADSIRKGTPYGLEGSLGNMDNPLSKLWHYSRLSCKPGASTLLLLSSLPRVAKGPIPVVLAVTAASTGVYYGKTVYALRNH